MGQAGIVRRIAAIAGSVVVVLAAWGCQRDFTGTRTIDWGDAGAALPTGLRPGAPTTPIVTAQTLREDSAGSGVRAAPTRAQPR